MTPFAVWIYRLPFLIFLTSAILLMVGKMLKWTTQPSRPAMVSSNDTEQQAGPTTATGNEKLVNLFTSLRSFARTQPWTLILVVVLTALLIFLLVTAPPRLTGVISSVPGQPGRPFYSLRWLRSTLSSSYNIFWTGTTIICSIVSMAILVWAAVKRSLFDAQVGLLAISLTLAGLGQWMIAPGNMLQAKIAYGAAVVGFVLWAWLARKRIREDLSRPTPTPRWLEVVFIIGLLILTTYGRLYAFPTIPYGIEGDEAKWTSEAVNVMMDGHPDPSGEYHRDALPVSYYLEAAFFRIFGTGIFAARLEVIITSILATLVFYWLLRQIAPTLLAMLGSFLLSSSIFDISASRYANVESHTKLWPILTLALLALAFRTKRWQIYALSGAALAFGLLTYDTVWPLVLVTLILGGTEIIRHIDTGKAKALQFAALIFPSVLVIPLLIPYLISRINYYNLGSKGWDSDLGGTLVRNLSGVVASWFIQARTDFLYNRVGPLLNSAILPWFAFGLVVLWFSIRQRFSRWTLVWILLFLLPVPILANSQMGRVVYPALPAVYAAIAFGMFLFWNEIARLMGNLKVIAGAISLGLLLWLPLLNFYIYFNEVSDAPDRRMRREISDIAAEAGGAGHLLLLPVVAGGDEPLANEYQVIEMALHYKLPINQIPTAYQTTPYDQFLPMLANDYADIPTLEIILDKASVREREQRNNVYAALMKCYPNGILTPGVFFDRYTIDQAAREDPACLPVELTLAPTVSGSSISLSWGLSQGTARQIHLGCDRRIDTLVWMEAEQVAHATGWIPESAYVTDWHGSGFLMDSVGSQQAIFMANLPEQDQGYVWIRYLKRASDNSPAMLSYGDQSFPFASASADLNIWVWERIGPYVLSESDQWVLIRPYSEDARKFMALFVDTLVFTANPLYDPQTSLSYVPLAEEIFSSNGQTHGMLSLALIPGHYKCQVQAVSTQPLVDALGNNPVSSPAVEFDVAE